MPKTQMQLANRAWRIETKALGWHRGWKKGRKQWEEFCQRNAKITLMECNTNSEQMKRSPIFRLECNEVRR